MDWENRCFQVGTAALVFAVLLRMWSSGPLGNFIRTISSQQVAAAAIFLETGQIVRPAAAEPPVTEQPSEEPTETASPEESAEPEQAILGPEDQQSVAVNCFCEYEPNVAAMLQEPLNWNLYGDEPTVLILHTHTTESYVNDAGYQEVGAFRCMDEQYNMVAIGETVKNLLEEQGIRVLHDKTVHDEPSYNEAYGKARVTAQKYLEQYPSIQLVLDLHRDAAEDANGNQVVTTTQALGQESAKLMIVVGTDAAGWEHPRWRENMALAVKLHASLQRTAPGICRPIAFRASRFNQDLSTGSLLIEVGTAGNTRQQAQVAAQVLAQGIESLAAGARWQEMQ